MEKLNLALVSSPKPLMLGHVPARDVFRRKHFSFGRVLIAPHRCRFRVSALSSSHHNPKSGIQFLNFFLLFCFYVCVFFGGGIRVFCYNLCLVGKKIHWITGFWWSQSNEMCVFEVEGKLIGQMMLLLFLFCFYFYFFVPSSVLQNKQTKKETELNMLVL